MKTVTSITLISLLALNFIFSACGDKKDETTQTKKEDKTTTQTPTQQTQTTVTAPKIGVIWNQVEKKNEALGQIIQEGKAGHFDEPIAEVINLLKTLPAKSTGLDQSKQELLKTKISELEKIGKTMDELHHSKKEPEVKKEYEKFTQNINDIKSIYPQESFN
ncbi:MAG: hypothetical protein M3R36_00480 [Bacteroidota bacterium]|nr:hypothetical protein [Bacteroidota bacterium]